jgi:SPP1 family predicted phage head-tail adaptor
MFNDELILISFENVVNEIGDVVPIHFRRSILCSVQSITRSEHYAAAQANLQPEIVFVVNEHDYNDEKMIEFNGREYRVIRHFKNQQPKAIGDFESIELICEGVIGHADS